MLLLNGDCLELMRTMPDKSVDLILTDPPYNIGKAKWDKIPNYIEWCGKWFKECERLLKDNGSFYFWHNDMVQIAQLMEWIRQNTRFVFRSMITVNKTDNNYIKDLYGSQEHFRNYLNIVEYCLFYTFQDETGLSQVLKNPAFYGLQKYFKDERKKTGATATELDRIMGIKASYCYWEKPTTHEYRIPDEKNYAALQRRFGVDAFRREYESLRQEYESLRQEYESLRQEYESLRFTHNLDPRHNNLWRSAQTNSGADHPCKKPIDLLERIVKTSSNPGDTVLDCFMGSGSTGVACVNTGRDFIGIELDAGYFAIAQKRIEQAQAAGVQARLEGV